jgi:membrane fusion protein, heavy metal efflux system
MLADRCAIVLTVALALSFSACGKRSGGGKPAPAKAAAKASETALSTLTLTPEAEARLGVEVVKVEKRAMAATISAPGEVIVPTGGSVVLVAPFAARVSADPEGGPQPGARVTRGQTLVKLSPLAPPDRDVRAQAERGVAAAAAQVEAIDARVKRLTKLLAEGGSSERQIEEARAELVARKAELDASTRRLATIQRAPLEADVSIPLRAPRDGLVRSVSVAPGQLVSAGAPLFEILGAPSMWVRAAVYAGEAARVAPEAPALVASLGSTATRDAMEAPAIALPVPAPPSADPAAATVDLFYELPAGATRRPGERVRVTLATRVPSEVLVVPRASVLLDAVGGTWVYARTADHAYERRRIDVARIENDFAVLARGPDVGTPVVSVGASALFGVEFGVGK